MHQWTSSLFWLWTFSWWRCVRSATFASPSRSTAASWKFHLSAPLQRMSLVWCTHFCAHSPRARQHCLLPPTCSISSSQLGTAHGPPPLGWMAPNDKQTFPTKAEGIGRDPRTQPLPPRPRPAAESARTEMQQVSFQPVLVALLKNLVTWRPRFEMPTGALQTASTTVHGVAGSANMMKWALPSIAMEACRRALQVLGVLLTVKYI